MLLGATSTLSRARRFLPSRGPQLPASLGSLWGPPADSRGARRGELSCAPVCVRHRQAARKRAEEEAGCGQPFARCATTQRYIPMRRARCSRRGRRSCPRPPLPALAGGACTVYITHQPAVIGLQFTLLAIGLPGGGKSALVTVAAVAWSGRPHCPDDAAICFAAGCAIRLLPGVKRIRRHHLPSTGGDARREVR